MDMDESCLSLSSFVGTTPKLPLKITSQSSLVNVGTEGRFLSSLYMFVQIGVSQHPKIGRSISCHAQHEDVSCVHLFSVLNSSL